MAFYISFILLAFSSIALANLQFTINNKCPQPITLYINGESQGSLASNGVISKIYSNNWSGFIYTNLNAGSGNTGVGTTRAGFYGNVSIIFEWLSIISYIPCSSGELLLYREGSE